MAILHEFTAEDDFWERLRFRVIRHTPTVLIDYLLEGLIALVSVLAGFFAVTDIFEPTSLAKTLPGWLLIGYGGLLLLGGMTVICALIAKRYGTVLPMGLRLLAGTFGVYAVAVLLTVGTVGFVAAITSLLVAVFAGWRAFLLRSTYLLVSKDPTLDFYRQ